jgi:isoamyl acetate esterase
MLFRTKGPYGDDPVMFLTLRPVILSSLALFVVASTTVAAEPVLELKKGDRILFLGDSITAGGVAPKGYITLIRKALAEKADVEIIGAGVSGNKVPDLQNRLERDVLNKKPTIVFIYIGINDVWHGEKNPANGTSKEKFEAGLKDIIGQITKTGARVVLCTPTVIGEKNEGANTLDARLDEYADISRAVSKELKVPLCDLRKEFQNHLKKNNPDNKESGVLTGDRVHLNDAGNQLVSEAMLKMLGR